MIYMGSKSKVAKFIVPILQEYIDNEKPWAYIEPFCGGCNIIDKIRANKRIAQDKQKYLIALFQNLDKLDNLPEELSREHYNEVRDAYRLETGIFQDWYIGAIGFLGSYNGRFFDGGYSGKTKIKSGKIRDYYNEAVYNLKQQAADLQNISFIHGDYSLIETENAVIYCDPPYKDTKKYGADKEFDYTKFWNWARKTSKENTVIISEREAPPDFRCIWEQPVKRTINHNKSITTKERLFVIGGSEK